MDTVQGKLRKVFPGRFNKIADETAAEPVAAPAQVPELESAPPQQASKRELAAPEGEDGFIQAIYNKDAAPADDTFGEQDPERAGEAPLNKRDSMSGQPLLPDLEPGDVAEDLPDRASEQQDPVHRTEDDPER